MFAVIIVLIRKNLFQFTYNCFNAIYTRAAADNNMVVFVGIAVLCLGALIARYLREKKCQSSECPQREPDPDTLMITVSYYPPPGAPPSQASQISEDVIQELHIAFVKSQVSKCLYVDNARSSRGLLSRCRMYKSGGFN